MATEFFIHKMSEHMETARILRWLVKEGDPVRQYQVIMEVETDKAVVDMEAPAAGVIRGIRPGAMEGAEVTVGETICWIAAPGEEITTQATGGLNPNRVLPVEAHGGEPLHEKLAIPSQTAGEVRATPLARKVARELGVDLALVSGSGPKGIIRDEDVRAFAAARGAAKDAAPQEGGVDAAESELVELSAIQALSARRMTLSAQSAPQFSLSLEADMTDALWLQNALMERVQAETGQKLSLTVLIVKVTAEALKAHPLANASYEEGKLRIYKKINLGVALGTDHGLVVPVIRSADGCSLAEVARQLAAYQEKAKTMHFAPADLEGGTFTLSNLGMYGILQFDAILNPPQSAILTVGKVVRRPVELAEGGIGLRPMMNLTLTADHRVMDGLQAARFLVEVKERMEKPYFLIS